MGEWPKVLYDKLPMSKIAGGRLVRSFDVIWCVLCPCTSERSIPRAERPWSCFFAGASRPPRRFAGQLAIQDYCPRPAFGFCGVGDAATDPDRGPLQAAKGLARGRHRHRHGRGQQRFVPFRLQVEGARVQEGPQGSASAPSRSASSPCGPRTLMRSSRSSGSRAAAAATRQQGPPWRRSLASAAWPWAAKLGRSTQCDLPNGVLSGLREAGPKVSCSLKEVQKRSGEGCEARRRGGELLAHALFLPRAYALPSWREAVSLHPGQTYASGAECHSLRTWG